MAVKTFKAKTLVFRNPTDLEKRSGYIPFAHIEQVAGRVIFAEGGMPQILGPKATLTALREAYKNQLNFKLVTIIPITISCQFDHGLTNEFGLSKNNLNHVKSKPRKRTAEKAG